MSSQVQSRYPFSMPSGWFVGWAKAASEDAAIQAAARPLASLAQARG